MGRSGFEEQFELEPASTNGSDQNAPAPPTMLEHNRAVRTLG